MSSTETAPTIRNPGTAPATRHKLFVNIPVADVQRSIDFFEALGFRFNPQFTDSTATCMLVGEDAYFMLMTRQRFAGFAKRPINDPMKETPGLYALSVDSRADVDRLVEKAISLGGSPAGERAEHGGFMYAWSFFDPDGHHWEVFWMDPAHVQG
jgi:uncharacterized protein